MGRVTTNTTGLQYARQSAFNTLGGSPSWKTVEMNGSVTFGADITTVPRSPISKNRQQQKGKTTDLDAALSYEADTTIDSIMDAAEGFCFATAVNSDLTFQGSNATATSDEFAVAALTAAQALKLEIGTLLWGAGYVNAGNNGMHVLSVDAASTDTTLTVVASTLVTETAPTNAEISVCGFRAATSDLAITVASGVATLTSTASVPDWAALGLTVGQMVHIGGLTTSEQFNAGAGFARILTIVSNVMTLDKLDSAVVTDTGVGDTVDILFGRFVRNVAVDHTDFLEQYFEFEASFPNLYETDPPTPVAEPDGFEYALNNLANVWSMNLPLTNKVTQTLSFVGTDVEPTVDGGSRKANAATPIEPLFVEAFNTSSDYARLRVIDVDETGITTDFKDWTVSFDNQASPEKVQGQLGAKFINTGNFKVNIDGTFLFTSALVTARIRANTTVSMDWILQNGDGAVAFDIPSMTLGGGGRDYAVNESVKVAVTAEAFQDATLGYSIGVSFFPVTPVSAA